MSQTFQMKLLKLGTEVHVLDVAGKKSTTVICRNGDSFVFFPSANSGEKCIRAAIKRKAKEFNVDDYVKINAGISGIDKAKKDALGLKEYLLDLTARI